MSSMEIDIKKLDAIKDELDSLDENDVLYINENGNSKYVLLPIESYDVLENKNSANVKIVTPFNGELTYDEYEAIKKQVLDILDKTFKPKREKLN